MKKFLLALALGVSACHPHSQPTAEPTDTPTTSPSDANEPSTPTPAPAPSEPNTPAPEPVPPVVIGVMDAGEFVATTFLVTKDPKTLGILFNDAEHGNGAGVFVIPELVELAGNKLALKSGEDLRIIGSSNACGVANGRTKLCAKENKCKAELSLQDHVFTELALRFADQSVVKYKALGVK